MDNVKEITKEEYIVEILKDDLSSGKFPLLEAHKEIIENPNLESKEENETRLDLVENNGGFGDIFKIANFGILFSADISKEKFLQLFWCSKPANKGEDEIDIISNGSRNLNSIMKNIDNIKLKEIPKVKKYVDEYFNERGCLSLERNKLFILEINRHLCIQNGNHRAGSIIKRLSLQKETLFPIKVFVARRINVNGNYI